jgi:antitoxin HicB
MSRYSMVIQWSEEDQAFIVSLPEFPNCRTHGATYEEAVKNGQEVLELIIESYREEGTPLPEPNLLRVA